MLSYLGRGDLLKLRWVFVSAELTPNRIGFERLIVRPIPAFADTAARVTGPCASILLILRGMTTRLPLRSLPDWRNGLKVDSKTSI